MNRKEVETGHDMPQKVGNLAGKERAVEVTLWLRGGVVATESESNKPVLRKQHSNLGNEKRWTVIRGLLSKH